MTKTKTKLTVRERIVHYLDKDSVPYADAKSISKRIKANYNSVRRELGILMKRGYVIPLLGESPRLYRTY